jgi:hypothetical protein
MRRAALAASLIGVALAVAFAAHSGASSAGAEPLRFVGGKRPAAPAPAIPTQWCGATEARADDRQPDAVGGRQAHVIYALPADGVDRFAQLASGIASDIASSDAWWRREDATRTLRFDLYPFPGCATTFGKLDISRVQLSQPGSAFSAAGRADLVAEAVFNAGFGSPFKKYIVLYDGPVEAPDICGASFIAPGESAYSVVYLQASVCPNDTGAGAFTASVIVHEFAHNLGAVPLGAPHRCPDGTAHVCDSPDDLMYPESHGQGLDELKLDIGRDDYYGHGGGWFDVQDSPWLDRLDNPDFPLTVTIEGSGTVVSDLPGISCPAGCSTAFEGGSIARLAARATPPWMFRGWRGDCTGNQTCPLSFDGPKAVTARFVVPVRLTVRIVGRGRVSSTPLGIFCPTACAGTFDSGTRITLRASARPGWRFAGWAGGCRGLRACVLTLARAATVSATFRRR